MSAIMYASIKARLAGVDLIDSGLIHTTALHTPHPQSHSQLHRHSYRNIDLAKILTRLDLPSTSKRSSQFSGKSIFHSKVESVYRYSPNSVRRFIDTLCLDTACDLLKSKVRSLHTIHSLSPEKQSRDTSMLEEGNGNFLNPEHSKLIQSVTTFSELESVICQMFHASDFRFNPEGDCRIHEEQIDKLYLQRILAVLSKSSLLCRRHLIYLYQLKLSLSNKIIDHRSAYHQIKTSDMQIIRASSVRVLTQKKRARDESRYLVLLMKALRRSPMTPLPIFAYILILEVWCNRAAGLLSRAQIEPGMDRS